MSDDLVFGSVFSGVGLLDYGLHLAGIRHAWFCEADEYRRGILARRWPGVPVYDDIRTVDAGRVGRVDGIAGGFPCKGASSAGKQEGFGHPETVLWREQARLVRELRPRYVVVENVANLLGLHDGECWGEVLGTLASFGYDTWWDCFPASAFGAPHGRDRVFLIAYADGDHGRGRDAAGRDASAARAGDKAAAAHAGGRAEAAADPDGAGREPQFDGSAQPVRAEQLGASSTGGIEVDWGEYEPAIRRWETILGRPAPEPLVRGLDARDPAVQRVRRRVERSRLSALGDGVQVQAGWLVGRMIVEHADG